MRIVAGAPAVAEKKAFLLRLDPAVWTALERIAQSDLRSVNAQIEFLLRDALSRRGIAPGQRPKSAAPLPRVAAPGGPGRRGKVD
ncbi:MAG: hypothetical protein ACHP7M_02465 [Burkholderiales bacterium]|jgi:hypothetical protein